MKRIQILLRPNGHRGSIWGKHARGFFLKSLPPAISTHYHDNAPYSLCTSPRVINIVTFNDDVEQIVTRLSRNEVARLGELQYDVVEVLCSDIDLRKIITRNLPSLKSWSFRFLTRTKLRSLGLNGDLNLPIPEHLYSNLAHLWNKSAGMDEQCPEAEFLAWVRANVAVFHGSLTIRAGFRGSVSFKTREPSLNWGWWVHALGLMAEFVGVGSGRTRGNGVVRFSAMEVI